QVAVPRLLAGGQIGGGEVAVGAEREHLPAGDRGGRPRAVVEPEVVAVLRAVAVLPLILAGRRVQAQENLLVADAVEDDQPLAGDDRRGPPGADVELPGRLRPPLRPGPVELGLGGGPVAGRPGEWR